MDRDDMHVATVWLSLDARMLNPPRTVLVVLASRLVTLVHCQSDIFLSRRLHPVGISQRICGQCLADASCLRGAVRWYIS